MLKGPRTRYCRMSRQCVDGFDHFCPWISNAVGHRNHRFFVAFCILEALTEFAHGWCCLSTAAALLPASDSWYWFYACAYQYPVLALVILTHCFGIPFMLMQFTFQIWIISRNLLTTETASVERYQNFWKPSAAKDLSKPCHIDDPWWMLIPPFMFFLVGDMMWARRTARVRQHVRKTNDAWHNSFDKGSRRLNFADWWERTSTIEPRFSLKTEKSS